MLCRQTIEYGASTLDLLVSVEIERPAQLNDRLLGETAILSSSGTRQRLVNIVGKFSHLQGRHADSFPHAILLRTACKRKASCSNGIRPPLAADEADGTTARANQPEPRALRSRHSAMDSTIKAIPVRGRTNATMAVLKIGSRPCSTAVQTR